MREAGRQGAGACHAAAQVLKSRSRRLPAAAEPRACDPAAACRESSRNGDNGSAMGAIASGGGWLTSRE